MNDALALTVAALALAALVAATVMHAWDLAERRSRERCRGRGYENHGDGI